MRGQSLGFVLQEGADPAVAVELRRRLHLAGRPAPLEDRLDGLVDEDLDDLGLLVVA